MTKASSWLEQPAKNEKEARFKYIKLAIEVASGCWVCVCVQLNGYPSPATAPLKPSEASNTQHTSPLEASEAFEDIEWRLVL